MVGERGAVGETTEGQQKDEGPGERLLKVTIDGDGRSLDFIKGVIVRVMMLCSLCLSEFQLL
jgi:hypothetical protein